MTNTVATSYERTVAELSHARLHALGAKLMGAESSRDEFHYQYRRWTIRIRVSQLADAAILEAHVRTSRGLNLRTLIAGGWESLLGPASVGPERMYPTAKSFLVELYEALMSRRDVQDHLAHSDRWPSAA